MIALERASEHDIARVGRRVAWRGIRQCRQWPDTHRLARRRCEESRSSTRSDAVVESDDRRSCARAGHQRLDGYRAVVAQIHPFDDRIPPE